MKVNHPFEDILEGLQLYPFFYMKNRYSWAKRSYTRRYGKFFFFCLCPFFHFFILLVIFV